VEQDSAARRQRLEGPTREGLAAIEIAGTRGLRLSLGGQSTEPVLTGPDGNASPSRAALCEAPTHRRRPARLGGCRRSARPGARNRTVRDHAEGGVSS